MSQYDTPQAVAYTQRRITELAATHPRLAARFLSDYQHAPNQRAAQQLGMDIETAANAARAGRLRREE